jgi:transcriptional regulator of acetoin/glycerol metabolism
MDMLLGTCYQQCMHLLLCWVDQSLPWRMAPELQCTQHVAVTISSHKNKTDARTQHLAFTCFSMLGLSNCSVCSIAVLLISQQKQANPQAKHSIAAAAVTRSCQPLVQQNFQRVSHDAMHSLLRTQPAPGAAAPALAAFSGYNNMQMLLAAANSISSLSSASCHTCFSKMPKQQRQTSHISTCCTILA